MASIGDRNPFGLLSNPTTPTPSRQRKRRREASTSNQIVVPPASVGSVKIYSRVRLPETEGFKFVQRHTPPKDLLEAPEIKSLVNSLGGTAIVSPSKSACSETEVHVDVNFGDLITRMKREIMDEVNSRMDRADARMDCIDARMDRADTRIDCIDARLNDHVAKFSFMLHCAKYASLRSVEDWALNRIKRVAKLPSEMPRRETIDFFLRNYEAPGVPKEYLLSLRHSSVRQSANDYVHMSPDDANAVDIMWNSLSRMLTAEERDKYRALMQFGRGLTSVRYVGGL